MAFRKGFLEVGCSDKRSHLRKRIASQEGTGHLAKAPSKESCSLVVAFLDAVVTHLVGSNVQEGRFILTYSWRGNSPLWREGHGSRLLGNGVYHRGFLTSWWISKQNVDRNKGRVMKLQFLPPTPTPHDLLPLARDSAS